MTDTSDIFSIYIYTHMIIKIISACTNNVYQALSLHAPPPQFERNVSVWGREAALKSYMYMYVSH